MAESSRVFISYARKDGSEHALRFQESLSTQGFSPWLDRRGIDPAQDFTAEIEKAIETASHIVTCITPDVRRDNNFVRREISYAQILQKPIIVARFADVPPPISVVNNTWLDFFRGWDDAFQRLCDLLRLNRSDHEPPPVESQSDPYKPYLEALYKQIVRYLDKTVFSVLPRQSHAPLIPLLSQTTPEAVAPPDDMHIQAMPLAFFDMAGIEDDQPATYHSVHAAFEENESRLLLLGDPGSGKTTTLMAFARDMVARRLVDPTQPVPVLAPIPLWDADQQPAPADWLSQVVPPLKADMAALLAQGNVLMLLDGLDELGDEREDPKTKELYDPRLRFIRLLPDTNPILITCRKKDYDTIPEKLRLQGAITLQPLDDEQLQNYLHDIPELWAALQADAQLREMARTPLLLSLFAYAFSGLGDEAKQLATVDQGEVRDRVFETYVTRRYAHEQRKPQANVAFSLDAIYERLGRAGMNNASDRKLPQNIFTVDDFGSESAQAFVELAVRLNILVPLSQGDRYRFVHLLVRDYFTFHYAVPHLADIDWGVVSSAALALAAVGDRRAVGPLLTAFTQGNTYVRSTVALVLGRFRAEEAIPALVSKLLSSKDPITTKRSISRALIEIGQPALGPIIDVFHGSNKGGQIEAAFVLGQLGAIDLLADALNSDDRDMRGSAAYGLSEASDPRALDLLLMIARNDDARIRLNVVRRLRQLAAPESVEILIMLLEDERAYLSYPWTGIIYGNRWILHQRICDIAAEALEKIGTPEALSAVETWRSQQDTSEQGDPSA